MYKISGTKHRRNKTEHTKGDRLESVNVESIEAGDIVDVPAWMDVWYGKGSITVQSWTFMTFDRVVIVEKGRQVSKHTPYQKDRH